MNNNNPLRSLIGNRIVKSSYNEASDSWLILFKSGATLNVECMWRLLEDGVITSTSYDHRQKFGRETPFNGEAALNEMAAYDIISIDCHVETGDVNIKLGEYFNLQIIPISAGYESWQFKGSDGLSIVAVSGQFHSY